jgi:hypothetical protein
MSIEPADWRLLATAAVAQIIVAAGLCVMRPLAVRTATTRLRRLAQSVGRGSEPRVVWAIEATGRRLRGISTCLVRAFVAELLLGSTTRPLCLTIGVKRAANGSLESHAWVADRDHVIIGAPSDGFAPVVQWDTPSA